MPRSSETTEAKSGETVLKVWRDGTQGLERQYSTISVVRGTLVFNFRLGRRVKLTLERVNLATEVVRSAEVCNNLERLLNNFPPEDTTSRKDGLLPGQLGQLLYLSNGTPKGRLTK